MGSKHTIAGKVPKIETGRRNLRHDWTEKPDYRERFLFLTKSLWPKRILERPRKARGHAKSGKLAEAGGGSEA